MRQDITGPAAQPHMTWTWFLRVDADDAGAVLACQARKGRCRIDEARGADYQDHVAELHVPLGVAPIRLGTLQAVFDLPGVSSSGDQSAIKRLEARQANS